MTLPARAVLQCAFFLFLAGLGMVPVQADGLTLSATFGLGGRYRPGAWCPVTVTIQGSGGETANGQLQVLATPAPGHSPYGQAGGNAALGSALFARPVSISGSSPQTFLVCARGIDPGRDSVTVQLVDGSKRGDGRVLAATDNEPTNTAPTITGTRLGDSDVFLVGLSTDPGAFTYLNGQKLTLKPNSALARPVPNNPGGNIVTAQVVSPRAAELPDKAAGYGGVDALLLRGDAPLDALTEAQADALKGWVASGGHLIIFCAGTDPSPFSSSFFNGLLPASVGPAGAGGTLTLSPLPLPGVRTLSRSPLLISMPYAAGRVTMTTYDPAAKASSTVSPGAFAQTLMDNDILHSSGLLSHVAEREENYEAWEYGGRTLFSDTVMRAPSLDAPGTEVIGLFLLVYLIVLVPSNYLILKRLDRKELAWVTIPGLVLIFAVGTFGVGYAAKGGAVFVNRAAIVETASGQRVAGVYAELGLFSPHRTSYDITIPGANVLAAIPNPGDGYNYRSQGSEMQSSGLTKFVQSPEGTSLLDTPVNMWAMRAFDTQSTTDLGGAIDVTLTGTGVATGTVTNHTNYDLTECVLLTHNQAQTLGALAHGASLPLYLAGKANNPPGGLYIPPLAGESNADDTHSDIRQRMRWALAGFARSFDQQNNSYGNGPGLPVYAPRSDEALLIGWSANPALAGPSPQIDGRTVHENDACLVIVHVPMDGK